MYVAAVAVEVVHVSGLGPSVLLEFWHSGFGSSGMLARGLDSNVT